MLTLCYPNTAQLNTHCEKVKKLGCIDLIASRFTLEVLNQHYYSSIILNESDSSYFRMRQHT